MTQLAQPPHPFLRGVDPSEPFDLMAYCLEVGKAYYRRQHELDAVRSASARHAEATLSAYYSGNPLPEPPAPLEPVQKPKRKIGRRGLSAKVSDLLRTNGPMTSKQISEALGVPRMTSMLYQMVRYRHIVREGDKGSHTATWRVLA